MVISGFGLDLMAGYSFVQMELLQNFYETTLDALRDAKNDRLWFKTNTKLGKLYFDRNDFNKLQKILKQLHASCQIKKSTTATLSGYDAFGEQVSY